MITRKRRNLGATACCEVFKRLRPGLRTLEFGSGMSTHMFWLAGCNHTALEHDGHYAPQLECVIVCPLVGDPPWYDWTPRGPYDLILIDGPPGYKGRTRAGIHRVAAGLVHERTVIVVDDTHRKRDRDIAKKLAGDLGMVYTDIPGTHPLDFRKRCAVLTPREIA